MRENKVSPDDAHLLEALLQKYNLATDSSSQFMTLINGNYTYEAANEAYCRAHHRRREEIIGRTVSDIWGWELFDHVLKEYLDSCLAGREVRHQSWFEFPSLGYRYFDVAYYPCAADGGMVTHAAVFSRDITGHSQVPETLRYTYKALDARSQQQVAALAQENEALRAEITRYEQKVAALQEAHLELERLVEARTAELVEANQQLEAVRESREATLLVEQDTAEEQTATVNGDNGAATQAAETRSEWLPHVGRQLLIPARTILDLCEALRQELFGPINDQQRYALYSLEASGQHVLNVVHGLADPSQPERGRPANVSLKSLFKDAWQAIRSPYPQRRKNSVNKRTP